MATVGLPSMKWIVQLVICTVADIEELLNQVEALAGDVPVKTRCQVLRERMTGTSATFAVNCDAEGR
jgi:hypothetical protein